MKETSTTYKNLSGALFLVEIMPIMFIPAAIGLIDLWPILQNNLVAYVLIVLASTTLVMGVAGKVCEWVVKK